MDEKIIIWKGGRAWSLACLRSPVVLNLFPEYQLYTNKARVNYSFLRRKVTKLKPLTSRMLTYYHCCASTKDMVVLQKKGFCSFYILYEIYLLCNVRYLAIILSTKHHHQYLLSSQNEHNLHIKRKKT